MSLVFVTGIYEIREGYIPELLENFCKLLEVFPKQGHIFVWTDLPEAIFANQIHHSGVHFLRASLTDFFSYQRIQTCAKNLPPIRTHEKDTKEYMGLMNAKLEMIVKTIPYWNLFGSFTHAAWIDFGIWKIFRNPQEISETFQELQIRAWSFRGMALPGCWERGNYATKDRICWRFSGGFFVVEKQSLVSDVWPLYLKTLEEDYLSHGLIAWEVNVWADMERRNSALFHWYFGGHDNAILKVPFN